MRVALAIPLVIFNIQVLFAQDIPGATVQPIWSMKYIFQDGTGQKDSVYVGYDPSATFFINGVDSTLGEVWFRVDTVTTFNVALGFSYSGDSISKVNIVPQLFNDKLVYEFSFINGVSPITIWWDKEGYSQSDIPFPNQSPAPNAQGNLAIDNLTTYNDNCPYSSPLLLTDTINEQFDPFGTFECFRSDSVHLISLIDSSLNEIISPMTLYIRAWDGGYTNDVADRVVSQNNVKLYPTFVESNIKLESENDISTMSIHTLFGSLITEIPIHNTTSIVDISNLENSVYLVIINTDNQELVYRIVKR